MDKNILKKFAIESRSELMEKMKNKISTYFVDEEFKTIQNGEIYSLVNDKRTLTYTKDVYKDRELLIRRIKEIGIEEVIEESAYTWFNRIIAIRYMELHDFLPLTKDNQSLGFRVLSSKNNEPDPEIMKLSNIANLELDIGLDKEYYLRLPDDTNKKFEYILLCVCKKLGKIIPQVFDGITDYIDILIPDNLLNESGYITKLLRDIPEDNFDQVEIIGWLYQYYNQTEKDKVMSEKKAYEKNEIPYVTQLFTPDWIVKYMVENSLGKYWIEHGGDRKLISNWNYYIDSNNQILVEKIDPQKIKCIDPCSGSGHILVYMFEVLFQIYESYGYSKKDISELILKNNLVGLDIDDRAGQLSILSVLLKAREYDKGLFNKDFINQVNIISIQESDHISQSIINSLKKDEIKDDARYLLKSFENAKEIGSLLVLEKRNYEELEKIINEDDTIFGIELKEKLIPLIKQTKILNDKYNIVVTNPPYMNSGSMSGKLKDYLNKYYKKSKADLCAAFMEIKFLEKDAYYAMINQHSWMFLNSYIDLREEIVNSTNISSMIHLGTRAFEEIGGEVVQTTSFVMSKTDNEREGLYIRLTEYDNAQLKKEKCKEAIKNKNYYRHCMNDYKSIPGYIIAYWLSKKFVDNFLRGNISDLIEPKIGLISGDNNRFLRLWSEVEYKKIGFNMTSIKQSIDSKLKWFPYQKGGEYRKWYGNNDYVVNWENDGYEMKNNNEVNGRVRSHNYNGEYSFLKGITWSSVTTGLFSGRYVDGGFLFDAAGPLCKVLKEEDILLILGFLCSKVATSYLKVLNPTINMHPGYIIQLPFINEIYSYKKNIEEIVKNNIKISKDDWDSFETSWDFKNHPLIEYINNQNGNDNYKISDVFETWKNICDKRFNQLKQNEEKLNKIFIELYGLQEELTPEVDEKLITIRKADREREIKSLISYSIGCMLGRYSLNQKGIVFAGGKFDLNCYKLFDVDIDNVLPITEEAYFNDDIVFRFKKFIEVTYGKKFLNENMNYIAETLGKKNDETDEDTLRRYFLNDFYKDHIQEYQKRPIYWLFDSGKNNGFKALMYMHRYNEGIVSKIRLDYLHRMQKAYQTELQNIEYNLNNGIDMSEKRKILKRQNDLTAKLQETEEYDEKIAHIADQRIKLDLDDGVVVNYGKFAYKNPKNGKTESILANYKEIAKKKE